MWLAYVDESYNSTYYYVGALLVRDRVINETQRALRDIVEDASDDYGIKDEAELHGYELFHGSADFLPMHDMPRARNRAVNIKPPSQKIEPLTLDGIGGS